MLQVERLDLLKVANCTVKISVRPEAAKKKKHSSASTFQLAVLLDISSLIVLTSELCPNNQMTTPPL
eukprot:Em1157g1a